MKECAGYLIMQLYIAMDVEENSGPSEVSITAGGFITIHLNSMTKKVIANNIIGKKMQHHHVTFLGVLMPLDIQKHVNPPRAAAL